MDVFRLADTQIEQPQGHLQAVPFFVDNLSSVLPSRMTRQPLTTNTTHLTVQTGLSSFCRDFVGMVHVRSIVPFLVIRVNLPKTSIG